MKALKKCFVSLALTLSSHLAVASPLCPNLFPNFIRDICWSCMFPIKIAGIELSFLPGARGNSDFKSGPNSPICLCTKQLKIGLPLSFWEQSHFIDVHTEPGCMPVLGGLRIPMPWNKSQYGKIENDNQRHRAAFRHSTYYVSPLMYLLEVVLDDGCADRSPFDVGWQSEFDPTWDDDELALIKMPIAYAFGSMPAVLAAGIDSAAAQIGFGFNQIFWQSGALGPTYPLTGNVKTYYSADQMSQLLTVRMLATAHTMIELAGLFTGGSGRTYGCEPGEFGCTKNMEEAIMCGGQPGEMPPTLIMPKKQYKIQRTAPVPATAKVDLGQCCHPIGRSPIATEAGVHAPLPGYKDFVYTIFRKRDCCAGVIQAQ